MFSSTIALFDTYYWHIDAARAPGFNADLACEVRVRLEQMQFIVNRVRALEIEVGAASERVWAAPFE